MLLSVIYAVLLLFVIVSVDGERSVPPLLFLQFNRWIEQVHEGAKFLETVCLCTRRTVSRESTSTASILSL